MMYHKTLPVPQTRNGIHLILHFSPIAAKIVVEIPL